MKTFLIRGVPMAMQHDGWWLSGSATPPGDRARAPGRGLPQMGRAGLLLALIALGDFLVWQVAPGLSLAVFGTLIVAAALWLAAPRVSLHTAALVGGGSLLAMLPLVELVQPLSFLIAVTGVSAMLVLLAGVRMRGLALAVVRLWPMGIVQTIADATATFRRPRGGAMADRLQGLVLGWLMPLSLGLVFAWLLVQANPIASRWIDALAQFQFDLPVGSRMAFWLLIAPLIWTCLSVTGMGERLAAALRPQKMGPAPLGVINAASVTRALVLFNAGFALQTGMDAIYLYGGIGLPEGITYAEYAHRGAYPLVVTALLAGGFALLTRRWTDGNAMLRGLLMLWVAQNLALVVSSLVRLDLYVGVYGLTHLRVAAAIWMALVAGGLALILWQVWRGHRNGWLMLRAGAMGAVVLYVCAWVSFDAIIARYNLTHPVRQDIAYLCNLGDAAKPVILAAERAQGRTICHRRTYIRAPRDWREWGFRNARARNSLARMMTENRP